MQYLASIAQPHLVNFNLMTAPSQLQSYERVQLGYISNCAALQGVLLVTGLSQCDKNYQASWLCEEPWRCKKPYRIEASMTRLAELGTAIFRNRFNLIIIAHPGPDKALAGNVGLNRALKTAVQQQGGQQWL